MKGYILIAPNGLLDLASLSSTRGAAQYHVVKQPGHDGRMHTWHYWKQHGWRCKPCEISILSEALTTSEDT